MILYKAHIYGIGMPLLFYLLNVCIAISTLNIAPSMQ